MFLLEKNKILKIRISGIKAFGLFTNLENDFKGMVHISEISDYFINDLNKIFSINDVLYAKILNYDIKNKKVVLSIKDVKQSIPIFASSYSQTIIYDTYGGFEICKKKLIEKLEKYEVNYEA